MGRLTGAEKGAGSMLLASVLTGSLAYSATAPLYLQKTKLQGLTGFVNWAVPGPGGTFATGRDAGKPVRSEPPFAPCSRPPTLPPAPFHHLRRAWESARTMLPTGFWRHPKRLSPHLPTAR